MIIFGAVKCKWKQKEPSVNQTLFGIFNNIIYYRIYSLRGCDWGMLFKKNCTCRKHISLFVSHLSL